MRKHYTWPCKGPLRDARHEFGAAIILDQEKHLCGKRIPTSLTRAVSSISLSIISLCKLGAQLTLFDVRTVVTPDLFPSPEASSDQQWSQMRQFRLEFHALRPDGRWYFVGPCGEDLHDSEQRGYKASDTEQYPRETDTDEDMDLHAEYNGNLGKAYDDGYNLDMFRVEPCRELIEPLLAAFAKSLARDNMPCLEDARIFMHLWWAPSDDIEAKNTICR
ncbi:uncharacterized protein EKO05_0005202 [Ascochyta rabiei]|uniref:uncharacterized protein n=1 Tax=Didymella rabiei TaxID=5454 RepID=UPI0021FCC96E|nr:uncharacterized protein EKO05_0005202 [Ascochyta rabiei]UPX14728.1 hypothetical protein EKO05_0005202 [Ascochyta rabiei]